MFYDTTSLTALRMAEAHHQAALEREIRSSDAAIGRGAGSAPTSTQRPVAPATTASLSRSEPPLQPASAAADCGPCGSVDQAA